MAIPLLPLAYLGPGGVLTAIGSFLALAAAVVLAVVGFVWYPLKRLVRARGQQSESQPPASS